MNEEECKEFEKEINEVYNILEANLTITNQNTTSLINEINSLKTSLAFLKLGFVLIAAAILVIALLFA